MIHFHCHHCSQPLLTKGRKHRAPCPRCHVWNDLPTIRPEPPTAQEPAKSRQLAALLALLLGNLGLHWLYLGNNNRAAWHIVFFALGLFFFPILIGLTIISLCDACRILAGTLPRSSPHASPR